jgi:hypothetical protein
MIVNRSIPYAAFCLLVAAEAAAILLLNHGGFSYTLDDAYIHLALAERIGTGTYGINVGEFAAPASSIVWPFMLAAFSRSGFLVLLPLILNVIAALASLTVLARTVRDAVAPGARGATGLPGDPRVAGATAVHGDPVDADVSRVMLAAFVTLLIAVTNLVPLAFTGMEHSLQQLLALLVVAGLIEETRTGKVPAYLLIAVLLAPLVRFDSLALSVPVLVYLGYRRHYRGCLLVSVLLVVSLGAFSWFLKSHGLGYLPTSVMAKADVMRTGGSAHALLIALYGNLVLSPQGNLLLVGWVLLVAASFDRERPRERGIALAIAAALFLQLVFGRVGAYFRYEAYLWSAALLTLIYLHRDRLRATLGPQSSVSRRFAVVGSLVAVSAGYGFALISTPLAASNIYDQQYQMHRFVVDYYKGAVAVNDLGWVAFQNPHYVLDFWGLGSAEAQQARMTDPSGLWMDRLCDKHGVDLILIYDDWFANRPSEWISLGKLKLVRGKVTPSGSEVRFYARDAGTAKRVRQELAEFAATLPAGAVFVPAAGS